MTTTVSVSPKGQVRLPESFRRKNRIESGTPLRVTEVANGLYITPVPEPTAKELRTVVSAAGSLVGAQTADQAALVRNVIADYRIEKRRRR